jgi:hypothetical protein
VNSILEPLPLIRQYQERGAPGALLGFGRPQTTQQQDWILKCFAGSASPSCRGLWPGHALLFPAWKGWGLESRHSKAGATPQQDWILKCLQGRSILSRPGDVRVRRTSESGKPKPRSPAGTAARPGPSRRRGRDVANRHEGLEERASGEERRTAVRSSLNPALRFTRRVWCDLACDPALRLAATVCGGDAQLFRDCLRLADYVSTKQGNRTALRLQVRASRRSASVRCPTFNC